MVTSGQQGYNLHIQLTKAFVTGKQEAYTRSPVGLTRIASFKTKACDSTDQVALQWSYTGRVQILHGGPGGGMCPVVSAEKEKDIFFKSRC